MSVNQASITKAAMAGIGLSILFAVANGVSSWILKDQQTIEQWATSTVGGV